MTSSPHLSRRTALGAVAWSAPVVVVAGAVPAHAASATRVLERVDPVTDALTLGTSQRSVRARLLDGTTPVASQSVLFTLASTTQVTLPGGVASATALTDANGVASITLVPVTGSTPMLGTAVSLTATHQTATLAWSVVDGAGQVYGAFVIQGIDEGLKELGPDGRPRKIEFSIDLLRVDDEAPV